MEVTVGLIHGGHTATKISIDTQYKENDIERAITMASIVADHHPHQKMNRHRLYKKITPL